MKNPGFQLFGLLLALVACGDGSDRPSGEDSSPPDPVVRDSAGIRIIESSAPAWDGDGWRVSDTPTVVIGRREGDERHLLGWVNWRSGAVVLRDGRIAVLDGRSAVIRVYSPEGEHIEDWARRGEGPGEFGSYPAHIFPYRGDSILVSEETLRFSVFDQEGLVAVVPDTGGVADSVGVFNGGRYRPGAAPGGRPGGVHFQPSFAVAVGPDGYLVTEGDSYSIEAYDANGRLARIIRLAREPRPVTDEVKAVYEAELREELLGSGDRLEGGSPEEAIRRALSVPYPPHLPTFEWLHVDPEGNIWAGQRRYGAGDDMNDFFVFAGDGRHLGIVEVPAKLSVLQIGTDFILAHFSDDLDVQYIHMYRIGK